MYSFKIENGVACNPTFRLKSPINVEIESSWQVAIVGPNGAGKSLLVNTLLRNYPLEDGAYVEYGCGICGDNIRYITFRDSYGALDSYYYYQQRWQSTEYDDSPRIADIFPKILETDWHDMLFSLFSLSSIWDKQLVTLSSGEMRRYQLAKALAVKPKVIIIDSPFIGLDATTRDMLCNLLEQIAKKWSIQIILVVNRERDIPEFITHILPIENGVCGNPIPISDYNGYGKILPNYSLMESLMNSIPKQSSLESSTFVKCNNVTLQYGDRKILDKVNWCVKKGEHWALLGVNGAGKSALLSLIYADNPQAYSCDIELFGFKRGGGESIWDIKRHIGYVSPEMHRSYSRHYPVIDIIASGLYDSIGLYKKIHDSERELCDIWLRVFGIEHLRNSDFYTLSSGQQRMVLLSRAFVKNPHLLILDEPLHGLDDNNRALALAAIELFCRDNEKSLIIVTHYPEELPKMVDQQKRLVRNS